MLSDEKPLNHSHSEPFVTVMAVIMPLEGKIQSHFSLFILIFIVYATPTSEISLFTIISSDLISFFMHFSCCELPSPVSHTSCPPEMYSNLPLLHYTLPGNFKHLSIYFPRHSFIVTHGYRLNASCTLPLLSSWRGLFLRRSSISNHDNSSHSTLFLFNFCLTPLPLDSSCNLLFTQPPLLPPPP